MRIRVHAAAVAALFAALSLPSHARELAPSDDEIRQAMIRESITAYAGSCPCPYNAARNGSRCGKRSAYSRPGGASPLCYPQDIPAGTVARYRQSHGLPAVR